MPDYNRAAALLEFTKGTPIEEIAQALAIPLSMLTRWRRDEQWDMLVPQLSASLAVVAMPSGGEQAERALQRIKENREKNLVIAQKLQEDLLDVVVKLREGKLKVKRVFANGTSAELDPSLRDRCDLALYAKNVADVSYRALGDAESAKNQHPDSGLPSAGQITIILPALIAAPREKLAVDIDSEVVRIEEPAIMAQGKGSLNHLKSAKTPA